MGIQCVEFVGPHGTSQFQFQSQWLKLLEVGWSSARSQMEVFAGTKRLLVDVCLCELMTGGICFWLSCRRKDSHIFWVAMSKVDDLYRGSSIVARRTFRSSCQVLERF